VIPRVLMVESGAGAPGPHPDDAETTVVRDGDAAIARLHLECFDALVVDLRLEPLDGWCLLARVGAWTERPRLVAIVSDRPEVVRARCLGADFCIAAGTPLDARALSPATKEMQWRRPPKTGSRRPTTSGVSA